MLRGKHSTATPVPNLVILLALYKVVVPEEFYLLIWMLLSTEPSCMASVYLSPSRRTIANESQYPCHIALRLPKWFNFKGVSCPAFIKNWIHVKLCSWNLIKLNRSLEDLPSIKSTISINPRFELWRTNFLHFFYTSFLCLIFLSDG